MMSWVSRNGGTYSKLIVIIVVPDLCRSDPGELRDILCRLESQVIEASVDLFSIKLVGGDEMGRIAFFF